MHKKKKAKNMQKRAENPKRERLAEQRKCAVCSAVFSSMIKRKWHMYTEHPKSFACHLCERRYTYPNDLASHITRVHEGQVPKSFACHLCERRYGHPGNLKEHIARFHEGQVPKFQCSICGNRLTTKNTLQDHMRTHTGEEPFKCEFCYRTFARKNELREHRMKHLGLLPPKPPRKIVNWALAKPHPNPKQHACNLCSARYNRPRNLKLHVEIHHEGKEGKFGCSICGKWLVSLHTLRDHLDVHRGIRSHKCKFCGDAFAWYSQFKTHLYERHPFGLVASKANPNEGSCKFACSRCDRHHSSRNELLLHFQSSHNVMITTNRRLTCCRCNKMFRNLPRFMRHMNSMHLKVRKFTCNTCGLAFKARDHLKKHIAEVHERTKALGCAICPYRNFHKERIVSHLVTRHYAFDALAPLAFPYKCDICDLGFFERRPFSQHAALHRSDAVWKCSECGMAYGGCEVLVRHLEAAHAYADKHSKLYVCSHCELRFGAAACLTEHASYHCNVMPHRCCACTAGYRTREELISHARKVHKPPVAAIPCLWCPKRLSIGERGERGEHTMHVIAHFGITRRPVTTKPLLKFQDSTYLTCQFPGPEGNRCGKKVKAGEASKHLRAHTTYTRFQCPKCVYGSRRGHKHIANHIRSAHPGFKPNGIIDNGALSTRPEYDQLRLQCFPGLTGT